MMKTFKHLEDYILTIAGYVENEKGRWVVGKQAVVSPFTGFNQPIVKLARYDVSVLDNFTHQIIQNIGFTPKQVDLAAKIITKYRRQLAKHAISVEPVEQGSVTCKLPLRNIDYRRILKVEDDEIRAFFPFDQKLIEQLRGFARDNSHGTVAWNQTDRYWKIALTDYNIMWAYNNLVVQNKFGTNTEFNDLLELCNSVEYNVPHLTLRDNEMVFVNAPSSLTNYIAENVGTVDMTNITRLIDLSGICKYNVDESLLTACVPDTVSHEFMLNSWIEVSESDRLVDIVRYIEHVDRFPIVIYQNAGEGLINWFKDFTGLEVYSEPQSDKRRYILEVGTKLHKKTLDTYPVLITSNGLIRGGSIRQGLFQRAEKTIFVSNGNARPNLSRLGVALKQALEEQTI